jgi:hypothetical protein
VRRRGGSLAADGPGRPHRRRRVLGPLQGEVRPPTRRGRLTSSVMVSSTEHNLCYWFLEVCNSEQAIVVAVHADRAAVRRFLAILAACAFLVGALKNQSGERRPKEGVTAFYRCTVLVAGVFAGGSLFSVAAAVVGIASYVAHEARAGFGPPQPPLSTTSETDGPRQGSHHACDSCGSNKAHAGTVC